MIWFIKSAQKTVKHLASPLYEGFVIMTLTKDFHPAQLTYVLESRRTAKYGNIATFVLGISACIVCVLPSHWSLKVSNIAIASGLFITSYKLEKLQKWSDDYQHSTNHESIKGY